MNFFKIVKQDFINILHNPALVISNTALPLILIGVLGFVTNGTFGSDITSYDYYSVNMLILTAALVAITASNAFMEEKVIRGNVRIHYAPVSKEEIYCSKAVSTYLFTAVCYGFLVPFCQYALGLNMGGNRFLGFVLLLNIFSFFGSCFGVMFCSLFKSEEQTNSIMQIPIFLSIFLGGILFHINRFGTAVNLLSYLSPVKWIADCSDQIIYDADFHLLLPVILGLILLSLLCLAICHLLFKPEEYV